VRRRVGRAGLSFELVQGLSANEAVERMRAAHNRTFQASKSWSYGPNTGKASAPRAATRRPAALARLESMRLQYVSERDFPACHSALDVYDLNGNAAEHMNLPLDPSRWRAWVVLSWASRNEG